jgi:hypothetical protein
MWDINEFKQASLLYWFPKLEALVQKKKGCILIPETKIVDLSSKNMSDFYDYLDGKSNPSFLENICAEISEHIAALDETPTFLRTDHTSGKHSYLKTCFLPSMDIKTIASHVAALIEDSAMKDLPVKAFVVRKFIEPLPGFTAFHGLPITRERRYFVKNGQVVCHHPYWPQDAIRFWENSTPPNNWEDILESLNAETEKECKILSTMAREVSKAITGYWSVDFMQAASGDWYLIDMAPGRLSWHPQNCKNATAKLK